MRGCVNSEINVPFLKKRDTSVIMGAKSTQMSQNSKYDISGTKRATKNLRIPNRSFCQDDSFSGPKLQLNDLEHV